MAQRKKISKTRAEKLWTELREGFVNQEKTIRAIIRMRAWEPLGYDSFTAAWNDRMQGVRLATDGIKAAVLYALFDETSDVDRVAKTLGVGAGITPNTIKNVKRQKDNGVPSDLASVRTWGYTLAAEPKTRPIIIRSVEAATYEQYEKWAEAAGSTLEKEAAKAVHEHFKALKPKRRRRAA